MTFIDFTYNKENMSLNPYNELFLTIKLFLTISVIGMRPSHPALSASLSHIGTTQKTNLYQRFLKMQRFVTCTGAFESATIDMVYNSTLNYVPITALHKYLLWQFKTPVLVYFLLNFFFFFKSKAYYGTSQNR